MPSIKEEILKRLSEEEIKPEEQVSQTFYMCKIATYSQWESANLFSLNAILDTEIQLAQSLWQRSISWRD